LPSDAAGAELPRILMPALGSVTTRRATEDEDDLDAGELGVC
jgi:hypothetical protein